MVEMEKFVILLKNLPNFPLDSSKNLQPDAVIL
jgi:hypothetical protein